MDQLTNTYTTIAGEEIEAVKVIEIAGTNVLITNQGARYVEREDGQAEPYIAPEGVDVDQEINLATQGEGVPVESPESDDSKIENWTSDDHAAGGEGIAGLNPPQTIEPEGIASEEAVMTGNDGSGEQLVVPPEEELGAGVADEPAPGSLEWFEKYGQGVPEETTELDAAADELAAEEAAAAEFDTGGAQEEPQA